MSSRTLAAYLQWNRQRERYPSTEAELGSGLVRIYPIEPR
jgi:hypothetical protein